MMKKPMLKRMAGSVLLAGMAVMSMAGAAQAATSEVGPNNFRFFFNGGETAYVYSDPAFKENNSECIVSYVSGEGLVRMSIVGYDDNLGIIENIRKEEILFNPGEQKNIRNWVIENELRKACLKGEAMDDTCIYAIGWWSADSVE